MEIAKFDIRRADGAATAGIAAAFGLPEFIAATLVSRGVDSEDAARDFLSPSLDRDWKDPHLIPGLTGVTDTLEAAIRAHKNILVFGDFDLDGISAATVLTRALRALGADAVPFIPRRFDEGYGLTEESLSRIRSLTPVPDVIVTVDCGIACKAAVATAVRDGFTVAVTDHHEPAGLVPEGIPVADPKLDPDCESGILAGVGVALKLVQALGSRLGQPYLWRTLTDLACLGTIADLMPMRAENRALVADGIARINTAPRPCLAALLSTAGAGDKAVTSTNLSFSVIPRLNAAGRMGDAQLALDLLMTDEFEEAAHIAARLEAVNDQRRSIEAELSRLAQEQAARVYHGERALVVADRGWHEGVKGIVASRLVNMYGVPTMLFTIDGNEARGSGRSVGQVNLFRAVESCADLLTRFGGHEAAVGVTLPTANLPAFRERLCAYMDALPPDDFHPLFRIDATVRLSELTLENVEQLSRLEPFGQDNPVPCFLADNVTIDNSRAVGADKNHLSCQITDGESSLSCIMFHCSDIAELVTTESVACAAFELQIDEWRGRRSVKGMLKALAPVTRCRALEACVKPETRTFVSDLYDEPRNLTAPAPATPEAKAALSEALERNRELWQNLARENPGELERAVIRALIGNAPLHDSQRAVLSALSGGSNVLTVMATSRGKSLIFQVGAAMIALHHHRASIFVYPLRALIADQAYHLRNTLKLFGITSDVLTGESPHDERERIFGELAAGKLDIVLTTPEFLDFHADEFVAAGNIGFVVVDEAHHIGEAAAGHRAAYLRLGQIISRFGNPLVLALTATANDGIADDIISTLPIDKLILDQTPRGNLFIDDKRNIRNRDAYLARIVATGEKTIVYVNSREQSVIVARLLRRACPALAMFIGFYNAGLNRDERKRIEDLFRKDELKVLVATSAFGEGVNIPDVRHVVLYHLPFNEVEFNQMSGRAGRDGRPAFIHLLYGRSDARINEQILSDLTPDREEMRQVYRFLRDLWRQHGCDTFAISDSDLNESLAHSPQPLPYSAVTCGITVFNELGLLSARVSYTDGEPTYFIRMVEGADRVELTDSVRYLEGLGEREIFRLFRDWALGSDLGHLQARVSHPITPSSGDETFGKDC